MKKRLRRFLDITAEKAKQKPYEYWAHRRFPITFDERFEGRDIQVEIYAVEVTPELVHLVISASDSPWGWWVRKHVGVIIRRES